MLIGSAGQVLITVGAELPGVDAKLIGNVARVPAGAELLVYQAALARAARRAGGPHVTSW
jgi:hypothetical protein